MELFHSYSNMGVSTIYTTPCNYLVSCGLELISNSLGDNVLTQSLFLDEALFFPDFLQILGLQASI